MTRGDDLTAFVKDALTQGVPRSEIEAILLQSGWSRKQVADALATFADVTFPIPVPKPRVYTQAREAFLYALLFGAMSFSAFNLGALIFEIIEYAFPLVDSDFDLREATRWPISILVVALPVFFYVTRLVNRDLQQDPSRRASRSRSQMTYVTLFLCAAVVLGVLAGLVYNFLGGEITTRFILKSVTVAVIAVGIFVYYLREMRMDGAETAT